MAKDYLTEKNILKLLHQRQIDGQCAVHVQRKLHLTHKLIARLGLEIELQGHSGCVNCLEWSENGELLASGSDDVQIIIWDPFRHKKLHTIQSGHNGNIFSVKFLPKSGNSIVVSGAADSRIRVHDVQSKETTMACSCHAGRVKRLAVAPEVPFIFWSAAEDGLILQFDYRVPHQCSSICRNVLVNLVNHLGKNAEAKCIAINPLQPELIAVGANDPFVRLYDRRMLPMSTFRHSSDNTSDQIWERTSTSQTTESNIVQEEDKVPPGCVTYFTAGHLPMKQPDFKKRYRTLASTYLAFSPNGNELLANLGGEQIYLFSIHHPDRPKTFEMQSFQSSANGSILSKNGPVHRNGKTNGLTSIDNSKRAFVLNLNKTNMLNIGQVSTSLPAKVEAIKRRANEKFAKKKYTVAITLYNQAIYIAPGYSVLYCNRAAAFMKRGWDGDIYAALRDCHLALKIDPDYLKAHLRLARCLHELHWTKEALECLQLFKVKFPDQAKIPECVTLEKDIKAQALKKSDSKDKTACSNFQTKKLTVSEKEKQWQSSAFDYEARFCGHCNTTTDIKEANFFGSAGQYIIAGSDDGSFFVWDRGTTNLVRVMRGDDSIVNCLQPHPSTCFLATSGIDPVVRLWSPRPEDGTKEDREVTDSEDAAVANQKRMNAYPLEAMLMNMGFRVPDLLEPDESESAGRNEDVISCRPS